MQVMKYSLFCGCSRRSDVARGCHSHTA